MKLQNNTAVLIIDIQEKLLNAVFNKDIVLNKSEIIAKASKILNLPTFVTEQYPKGLGETVPSIKTNLPKLTQYFEKIAFNALQDETLLKQLTETKCKNIIVIGIETHICVHQTVMELLNKGFNPIIISDSCGSRDEFEYKSALEFFKYKNVDVKTTEMVLFELLETAKHPNFKEIQNLIK